MGLDSFSHTGCGDDIEISSSVLHANRDGEHHKITVL